MSFLDLFRKKNRKLLFTTPSHSQKFCIVNKFRHFYKCDLSETDAHNPEIVLEKAQKRASEIYGTKQTLFLTNGSSSGIITGVLATTKKNDNVLIWDKSHRCHKNGVELAGCKPVYYELPTNKEWGIPDKTTAEILEPHLKQGNIKTVIVTSPSYYGIVSDIPKIKKMCEKYNAYLIVDEAHGALYPFSDKLPESAVKVADITVQSLHKTAGGLNPTALIHSNLNYDLQPYFDKVNTTSPSYPLLATIEANINYLNGKGRIYTDKLIDSIKELRESAPNIEFGGDDITKILIKKNGLTGYQLSELLFDKYNIEDEITNKESTMLLTGIGTSEKKLKKLKDALAKIS
ncbi:MAG: aminotransferase class I/II-fold pyridoxal phosphate-dependent enzyme [Cyanobacteria bacterium RUI128]|nr:aminotransferase class I/II-fold pyridoxal phosphate-dependent enzyme [Cyanobacteria bacterium RUI128]